MGVLIVFGSLGLARFGYSLVLPAMQTSLGIKNTHAGALATANLIGYLATSVIGGALASRFGPKAVITAGLSLAGCSMILTGLAHNFYTIAVWRAITGIGSGASNVPVMGLMAAWFSTRRRGMATGIAASGSSVALIVLGPLVPYILSVFGNEGWRVCWLFFGGVTLILALGSYILLRNNPSELGLKPVGSDTDTPSVAPKKKGLQWGLVYRSKPVWHLGFVYIAFGFSYIIYMTFFFKHLISEGGYLQEAAGRLFMVMGWFSMLCGLIWGMVSDVIGRKYTLFIVYILQAIAYSLFALWATPMGFTISAIIFGLTAWSIPAIMAAACGDVLGPRLAPAALGFITLFFGIGQALGPSVAGAIADVVGSFYPAFLLAAGAALLGAIGSVTLRPVAKSPEN
ncbi:MAG: MFS transporter [Candidatus Latescibacteria bacterium]|nr:MFS transporter [Candidatus Latescibacterota bacterium]